MSGKPSKLVGYAFAAFVIGIGVVAAVFAWSTWRWTAASDVSTVVSAAGGIIGTLVGAIIGFLSGAAGKELAEERRDEAEMRLRALQGETTPDVYENARKKYPKLFADRS